MIMKKLILLLLLIPFISFGQNLNGYKYLITNDIVYKDGSINKFNIDKIFKESFRKKGFIILESSTLSSEDEKRLLSTDYFCKILTLGISHTGVSVGRNTVNFKLFNCNGDVVFSGSGGATTTSFQSDLNVATRRSLKSFDKISYTFNESMTPIEKDLSFDLSYLNVDSKSEESIRNYLDSKEINSIEGIWEYSSSDNSNYKLAITKEGYKYNATILEGVNRWRPGELKAVIEPSASNAIKTIRWTMGDKKTVVKAIAKVTNNALMEFELKNPNNQSSDLSKTILYKSYPSLEKTNERNISINSKWAGNGSGIIISKSGYIATNHHVIKDANKIEVEFNYEGQKSNFNAEVVQVDKINDLAIIKIFDMKFDGLENVPYNFKTRSSDIGTDVFALGYPKALTSMGTDIKFTDGRISSKSGYQGDITTYQTTTAIQPGNSGGPLFDTNANLIGINSAKIVADDVEGVSYSIKTNYLLNLIDVLPKSITLPNDKSLSASPLTEQIKELSKYTVLIKVK